MSVPFGFRIGRRVCGAIISAVGTAVLCAAASGQTPASGPASKPTATRPAAPTHAQWLAAAAKTPILTTRYRPADAKPLTDEEKAEITKGDDQMRQAEESRQRGDYEAAASEASNAATGYKRVLGDQHFLTVSATIAWRTLNEFAKAKAADRKRLAEADAACATSGEAFIRGDYAAAVDAAKKAVQIRGDILGKEHVEVGLAFLAEGKAEIEARDLPSAAKTLERVLSIIQREYGERHPQTALVLDRLGWQKLNQAARGAMQQAVIDQAVGSLRRAVTILRDTVGETRETAEAQDNLGTVEYYTREIERAIDDKLRALHVREKVLGPEDRDTGVSLSNVAWLYEQIGLPDEVMDLRQRALAVFEKSLGRDHPFARSEALNLSTAYQRRGMWDDSIKLLEQFVGGSQESADRPPSVELADAFGRLGAAYLRKGRLSEADKAITQGFNQAAALQKVGDVPGAIAAMERLASLFQQQRMFDDAVRAYEQTRAWEQAGTAPDEAGRVRRNQQLAAVYVEVGRYQEALDILKDVVARTEKLYGKDSLEIAATLRLLGTNYEKLGQFPEAEKSCDRALRICESKLPRGALPQIYITMAMEHILVQAGKFDLAKFFIDDAKELVKPHEQNNPGLLIQVQLDEAKLLQGLGQKAEGIKVLREALDSCRRQIVRAPGLGNDAALTQCLKPLIEALSRDNPEQQKEYETLKGELKTVLERLRDQRTLDAEGKRWLEEFKS